MRILLTGGSGFVGKSIYRYLKNQHTIFTPTHKQLDLLNLEQIKKFILDNEIECVIHSAIIISRGTAPLNWDKMYDNILISENVLTASRLCRYIINIAGGNEFDIYTHIVENKESDILDTVPKEYFSLVKNIVAKRVITSNHPIGFNIRFLGSFGIYEKEDRFFKSCFNSILQNKPIIIYQNRLMDFIYIEDFVNIVGYVLKNMQNVPRDINCAYSQKYTLLELAQIICKTVNATTDIIVQKPDMALSYTVNNDRLQNMQIPLLGLEYGIKQMYKEMKEYCL